MQTNDPHNVTPITQRLFGEPTNAKASGLAYSLAAILPAFLSVALMGAFSSFGLLAEGYQTQDWFLYVNYLLPQICFALVALFFLRYTKTPVKAALKAQKCPMKYVGIALLLQVGLFSLSELNALFLTFLEHFGYTPQEIALPNVDGFGFVGVLLTVALLPAVMEEIFFRGALLEGLKSQGETAAALICGALFSLYHQNPPQTVYQFCCGAAFALVAIRSGSVLPTVAAHFLNNAVILTLYKFGVTGCPTPVFIVYMAVSVACLLAAVWLLWRDKNRADQTQKPVGELKRFFLFAALGVAVCALTWLLMLFTGI